MKAKNLLLLVAPMLLASCGGGSESYEPVSVSLDDSDASVSVSYSGGKKAIKILFHVDKSTAEGKAYQRRIDAFNAVYKDVGLRAVPTFKSRNSGGTDYELYLTSLQLDGSLHDIITFDAPNCASYADAGLLWDITSEVSAEEQSDFLSINKYQNKIYGLPIQESSAGFFYNKKIFREAGIDVSGYTVEHPWTFDQFKEVCGKLKTYGTMPVDMRMDATGDEMGTYLLYSIIHAAGAQMVSSDGETAEGYLNSDASKRGFQFLKDLVEAGYTSYNIGASDFVTGKTGMYLSSGWTIPELDSKYPQQFPDRDSWGLLPYPMDVRRASATGSWSYAITDNGTADKTAAMELLKWMSSTNSCTTVTDATGMLPCRKSCNPDYQPGSPEKTLFDQLAETGIERPVTVHYPQFTTAFSNIIYGLRNSTVDAVVDKVTADLQKEFDRD